MAVWNEISQPYILQNLRKHTNRGWEKLHVLRTYPVLAGLQQAGAVAWEALPRPDDRLPPWARPGATGVHWPAME